jgi:glycosyltransferase involved in cell wall biosynthesis
MNKLSVVLAVRNEEENIGRCLKSIVDIAGEIIVFDEQSNDDTVKIAKSYGAKVFERPHQDNFHITKQKAIDKAKGEWILQLDADEVVTPTLAKEISEVIKMTDDEIKARPIPDLLLRHQNLIEKRDGRLGKEASEVVAFFLPRRNIFLGKPLVHAGAYPDGVIRLIKKGYARLPAKSVHEQMEIDGQVAWLFNDLEHYDSPTLRRYLIRMNRYTDLHAQDLGSRKTPKSFIYYILYTIYKPLIVFLKLYIRHKGFLDGIRGFLWSAFSALHYPLAYYKYLTS